MKFTYVGDEDVTEAFGYTFPKGVPVEVTNVAAIAKLKHSNQFASVDEPGDPNVSAEPMPRLLRKKKSAPVSDDGEV